MIFFYPVQVSGQGRSPDDPGRGEMRDGTLFRGPGCGRWWSGARGATLIELIISIVITAIVITLVYHAWTHTNRHITRQTRASLFRREAAQVLARIATEVRRGEGLLYWYESSLSTVGATGSDTITYHYDGLELYRNDVPVTLVSPEARVVSFHVSLPEGEPAFPDQPALIRIEIGMEDAFDNRVLIHKEVAAPVLDDAGSSGEEWNYF